MMPERITILGDGQMGLVLAAILAGDREAPDRPQPGITLWGHDAEAIEHLAQTRRSDRLPQIVVPDTIEITPSSAAALDGATIILCAVPTQFIRSVMGRVRAHIGAPDESAIVSVSKGVETSTLLSPLGVIADVLNEPTPGNGARSFGVLSGPTIAAELAKCLPATMVVASTDDELSKRVQAQLSTSWLRIYTATDALGVELAGATKNVIAIAAGILDGLHAGYNAKSALLARGLAEIARLGAAMGAQRETFFGVAGVGDLATTCFSPEGRNRS